jgi:hydroxyacid-oxoacid transhydrogenase
VTQATHVTQATLSPDSVFDFVAANIRFGAGVTREVGMDLADSGARRVLVVTDPVVARLPPVQHVLESLDEQRVAAVLYDRAAVEPTDRSFLDAITFGREQAFDAIVAVGGGSAIDTAKAVNLYTRYPPTDFRDYVNAPVGRALPVPGPLMPLFALPTTAGTGSETTGVCIFDDTSLHVKTGISSRRLKPTLALLDPDNTRTLPPMVAASSGLDILCHAVESYTAIPFDARPRPERPATRPPYQGANPISDVWSLQALRMLAQWFVRAVEDPADDEARGQMLLAAAYAGIGFGTAGVHLPHAMSYPVSGHVRGYRPADYPGAGPLVPHGMSVILNAPAAFRFTAPANPRRHLDAAAALGADVSRVSDADAGRVLADRITWFMDRLGMPSGLRAVGYDTADLPVLVEGTLLQQRLTKLSPRPAMADDFARMFEQAL